MSQRRIYILLTRFPDYGTKAIEVLTGCYYPHTSIGLDEDLNTFYSFVTRGFIVEKITRYVRPDREPYPCELYEFEVSENAYNSIKNVLGFYVEFKKLLRYSKMGLILSLLRIPYKRDRYSCFCSQFVAEVLQHSGAVKLSKKSTRYFSEDIKRVPGMKLCFQGNMETLMKYCGIIPQPI